MTSHIKKKSLHSMYVVRLDNCNNLILQERFDIVVLTDKYTAPHIT